MSRAISVNHADYRCDAAACGYPAPAEPEQADPFDAAVSRALGNVISDNADDLAANLCDALARPDPQAAWADLYRVVGQMRSALSRELVKLGYAPLPGLPKIGERP